MCSIDDKMWFRKYKKDNVGSYSLCNHYSKTSLKSMVIVSRPTEHGVYEYAAFQNYTKLYIYLNSLREEDRILHDVPIHNFLQKPRFDIDINAKGIENVMSFGDNLRNRLLDRIAKELENLEVPFSPERNLLIYNTNRKTKYSSHIIVPGLVHTNNRQAREFYDKVVEGDEELMEYVDRAIYDKNHSLRLVGCTKRDSEVCKVLEREFVFRGRTFRHELPFIPDDDVHERLALFSESIICHHTACMVIPDYYIENSKYNSNPMPDAESDEMIKLMICKFGEDPPFIFKNSSGNMVWLKRTRTSYCEVCERSHEAKGPSLQRSSDGSVYFHCRRAEKHKKIYIGKVDVPEHVHSAVTSFLEDNLEDVGISEWEGLLLQEFIENVPTKLEEKEDEITAPVEMEGVNSGKNKYNTKRRRLTIREKRERLTSKKNCDQEEQAKMDRRELLCASLYDRKKRK